MSAETPSSTTAGGASGLRAAISACAEQVRRHDRDRFVAALFAAPADRATLFALYAFNLELARVREAVSEPALGDIRLEWWRENVEQIRAGRPVRQHPVALALAAASASHDLPADVLDRLIAGRAFDLTDDRPATLDVLEDYASATAGELGALAAQALGATGEGVEAARRAGVAWGLAGLMRAVPFHAAQGRIYLPLGDLPEGPSRRALLSGAIDPAICAALARIGGRAREALAAARAAAPHLPARALPALLPAALVECDLNRLERAGYDVFALRPPPPLPRIVRMLVARLRGRI